MEIKKIIDHYIKNYSSKIFMTKLSVEGKNAYLMYIYQYEKELENFSETFLAYLPFYIRASDYFSSFDDNLDLDEELKKRSKAIKEKSAVVPSRTPERSGIYGELFLDFYLRIINAKKLILTYANKRSFNTNSETTGPDNVVYYVDADNNINVCMCEAKFVGGASNARNALLEDISGTSLKMGHVTTEYLNDYFQFIVEKEFKVDISDETIFHSFLFDLNRQLDNGNNFVQILIDHNICVNFIFFAIFDSRKRKPEDLLQYYNEIYNQCKENVEDIGISKYKIEIVFVPTENTTMRIKEEIEKAYE